MRFGLPCWRLKAHIQRLVAEDVRRKRDKTRRDSCEVEGTLSLRYVSIRGTRGCKEATNVINGVKQKSEGGVVSEGRGNGIEKRNLKGGGLLGMKNGFRKNGLNMLHDDEFVGLGKRSEFPLEERSNGLMKRVKRGLVSDLGLEMVPRQDRNGLTVDQSRTRQSTKRVKTEPFQTSMQGLKSPDSKIVPGQSLFPSKTNTSAFPPIANSTLTTQQDSQNLSFPSSESNPILSPECLNKSLPDEYNSRIGDLLRNSEFGVSRLHQQRKEELSRVLRNVMLNFVSPENAKSCLRNQVTFVRLQVSIRDSSFRKQPFMLKVAFVLHLWYQNVSSKLPFESFRKIFSTSIKLNVSFLKSVSKR